MLYLLSKAFWLVAQPRHLLILLLALGAVLLFTRWRRLGHGLVALALLLILTIAVLPVGSWLLVPLENRFPPLEQMPVQVDGVIMLDGPGTTQFAAERGHQLVNQRADQFVVFADLAGRYPHAKLVFAGDAPLLQGGVCRAADDVCQALQRMGGEGVAYHDVDTMNRGGAYRTSEAVDLHATSDTIPTPTPSPSTTTGSAKWLSESKFVMGVNETGRVGYLEAFGGDEFGYAYTYSISGAPAGLTADADTGMLNLSSGLAAGTYNFTATVRNRKVTSKAATFPVTLKIDPSIQMKTYTVDSGAYGSPSGNDYTQVLLTINKQIKNDQNAAGDEKLHVTIIFHGGKVYQYSENRWTYGMQYVTIRTDSAGVRAKLQNTLLSDSHAAMAILNLGRGYFSCVTITSAPICDAPRQNGHKINTNTAGTNNVTLKNSADAAKFTLGRWVMVGSYDQQFGGFPPNIRYHEYARVASTSGATVTLDRNLRYSHRDNYPENPNETASLGVARIYVIDRNDERMTLRATVKDIEFLANPNGGSPGMILYACALDSSFENTVIPTFDPSAAREVRVYGGLIPNGEPDKDVSLMSIDNATIGTLGEGTGFDYVLYRNSTVVSSDICPRQLRAIGSSFNGTYPIQCPGWATSQMDVQTSSVTVNGGRVFSAWRGPVLTLGTDATWKGNALVVSMNSGTIDPSSGGANWIAFARTISEGSFVYAGNYVSGSAGYITRIYGDSSNIYADVTWVVGTKPTSGLIYAASLHDLHVDSATTLHGASSWSSEDAARYVFPGVSHPFPSGYPAATYGL